MIGAVNIDGPLHVGDGYSQITRGLIKAFTRLGVEAYSCTNWNLYPADPEPEVVAAIERGHRGGIPGIRLSQPDSFEICPGSPKVGFSMWEFDQMPRARWKNLHNGEYQGIKPWGEGANDADIVLAPSQHSRQLFLDAGCTKPVHVVPLGYDRDCYHPASPLTDKHVRPFTYVMAGTLSGRKNPNLVYECFTELFGDCKGVLLVMKSCAHLPLRLEPRGNIQIINEDWPHRHLANLYRTADVFVNPTQGEGFGLTNIEAMAAGLPVIVTNWSAPPDYVDEDCGWLVGWDWAEMGSDFCLSDDPHEDPLKWQVFRYAQPRKEEVKEAMWEAFTRRKETREKGRMAAVRAQGYTWEHTAIKISEILEGFNG